MDTSTFAGIAQTQDTALRAAMDAVTSASLSYAVTPLRALLVIYVAITFLLFAGGSLGRNGLIGRLLRAAFVWMIVTSGTVYASDIRDLCFDGIPNQIATTINGQGATISAAAQFDKVSAAADSMVAAVRAQNTGWSVSALSNAIGAWIATAGLQFVLGVMCAVWLLGRKLMAVVLCFGPWLICFELFDRTRGWVDQWLGKIVGLLVFQLASSVLLQLMLTGEMNLMQQFHNATSVGVDEAVGQLFHVVVMVAMDAITMLALPAVCAIGSGAAAGHGYIAGMAASAPMRGARYAGSVGYGAGQGARTVVNAVRRRNA